MGDGLIAGKGAKCGRKAFGVKRGGVAGRMRMGQRMTMKNSRLVETKTNMIAMKK